jgi:hypothetical protein
MLAPVICPTTQTISSNTGNACLPFYIPLTCQWQTLSTTMIRFWKPHWDHSYIPQWESSEQMRWQQWPSSHWQEQKTWSKWMQMRKHHQTPPEITNPQHNKNPSWYFAIFLCKWTNWYFSGSHITSAMHIRCVLPQCQF